MNKVLEVFQNFITIRRLSSIEWTDIAEIIILAFLIYHILLWIKTTRAWTLVKALR